MGKKKPQRHNLKGFFGNTKDYYVFAVKSDLPLFSLALHLCRYFGCEFSYLGELESFENEYDTHFKMVYSKASEMDDIHFTILENKTTLFHHSAYPKSKNERNLNFHTLSLFDEYLYIFNAQGIYLHSWQYVDYDYVFLIYTEKGRNIDDFLSKLLQYEKFKSKEATDLLEIAKDGNSKRVYFLQDLFCMVEIKISEFYKKKQNDLLSLRKEIPTANLLYKGYEEITPVYKSTFIEYLKEDPSFL
ncbi:MAG: hypothetical protein RR356_03800 [Bacteroidales bacterium]